MNDLKILGQILRDIRMSQKMTLEALSKRIQMISGKKPSPGHISRIERGEVEPGILYMTAHTTALNTTLDAILNTAADDTPRKPDTSHEINTVPIYKWLEPDGYPGITDPRRCEKAIPPKPVKSGSFALTVQSSSMASATGASFPEGCLIFVSPLDKTPQNGDFVITHRNGDKTCNFRQLRLEGGQRLLYPLNDRYPITDAKRDTNFIGKVVSMAWYTDL